MQRIADGCEPNLCIAAIRGRISEVRIKTSDFAPLGVNALDHCGGNRPGISTTSQFEWGVDACNRGSVFQATHDPCYRHRLAVVDPEQKSILAGSPFEFHAGWNRIVRDGFSVERDQPIGE
jgi:hypothetical protein